MVPQGEWLHYLQEALHFKPSTAQNYMRIAREFGDGQIALDGMSATDLFGELGYSQLVPLLGLPDEERRQLAEQNDLPEMSSREIKKLVKAAKAAEKAAKKAEDEIHAREAAEARMREMEGQVADLMRQLREKPIEARAEVVPDRELLERAREQVRAETEDALRDARERTEAANAALEQAKNPSVHQVNFLFGELRGVSERLDTAFEKLREQQPETAGKFGQVIGRWLAQAAAGWNL